MPRRSLIIQIGHQHLHRRISDPQRRARITRNAGGAAASLGGNSQYPSPDRARRTSRFQQRADPLHCLANPRRRQAQSPPAAPQSSPPDPLWHEPQPPAESPPRAAPRPAMRRASGLVLRTAPRAVRDPPHPQLQMPTRPRRTRTPVSRPHPQSPARSPPRAPLSPPQSPSFTAIRAGANHFRVEKRSPSRNISSTSAASVPD